MVKFFKKLLTKAFYIDIIAKSLENVKKLLTSEHKTVIIIKSSK